MFYLLLFIIIVNMTLGAIVLINNYKKKSNISFFIFVIAFSFWLLINYLADNAATHNQNLFLTKLTMLAALSLGCAFYFLVSSFSKQKSIFIKLKYVVIVLASFLSCISIFSTSIVKNTSIVSGVTQVEFGKFIILYAVYLAVVLFLSVIISLISYLRSRGNDRARLALLGVGLMLSLSISFITNMLFPVIANNYSLTPFGGYSIIIFVFMTTYAIIKHKFMDIRLVVGRAIAYLLLLIILAAIYVGLILSFEKLIFPQYYSQFNLMQGVLRVTVSVLMVFLFQPLRKWITKVTDKIFFKNQYDQDDLLSELSNTMGSTIVLVELLYKVGDIVTKNLKSSRVLFALIRDDSRMYASQGIGYKKTPEVDPKDVIKLTKDGMICADDLAEGSRIKHLMREYQATLAIPLKTEQEIVGLMFLGEKNSGDMYSQQDLSVLEILAPELAIAIENAKSYEEISRFNTTLRQEVKRATYRLKQKNEQLMELDHAKDEFISMASHQLRTPLTAIKGYLSMLLEGDAGDIKVSQYDFINEAYSGANRMVGLINDLLNVSRMDTGRFFLEPKDVDIEKVVGEEVKQLSNSAKAKGLYLKIETKGKIPHIYADETKIRQVVMNFMDNAIYYTNTGGVTVVLRSDRQNFIYEVHDTGIGVPKSQRDHLFEKFFRADNARTARPDGTGLGIYLAKRVVADHGGEIIFESTEGKGSVFGFKFPLKKKPIPTLTSAPVPKRVTPPATMPKATDIAAKHIGE